MASKDYKKRVLALSPQMRCVGIGAEAKALSIH